MMKTTFFAKMFKREKVAVTLNESEASNLSALFTLLKNAHPIEKEIWKGLNAIKSPLAVQIHDYWNDTAFVAAMLNKLSERCREVYQRRNPD